MKALRLLSLVMLACLAGCSAHTENSVQKDHRQQRENPNPNSDQQSRIAPGRCRIVGTLMEIDSTLENGGPCSMAPCRGIVRVDSVLGYGAAFGIPIAVHERVNVRFAFTLAPTTKALFPTMTEELPGLQVGARFQTDLESQNGPGMSRQRFPYVVEDYKRLK
jgi:hypothetical protein